MFDARWLRTQVYDGNMRADSFWITDVTFIHGGETSLRQCTAFCTMCYSSVTAALWRRQTSIRPCRQLLPGSKDAALGVRQSLAFSLHLRVGRDPSLSKALTYLSFLCSLLTVYLPPGSFPFLYPCTGSYGNDRAARQ